MNILLAILLTVYQAAGASWLFVGQNWANVKAINFGSSNSSKYMSAGDVHNGISYSAAFSLCAWIAPETMSGDGLLFSNETGAGTGWDFRFTGADKLQWYSSANAGTNRIQVASSGTISKSVYHHVCVTHSGNSSATGMQFWVDGSSIAVAVGFNNITADWTGGTAFNVCTYNSGAGAWCKAKIDEVNIWTIELDSAKVNELYNSGVPRNPQTTTFWANNTSYYRMGDLTDSHTSVVDRGFVGGVNLSSSTLVSGDLTTSIP